MTTRKRLTVASRRAQLISEAATAFAARAYPAVEMTEIATAAGVSRALLYRHFPTKADLFAAVYRLASEKLLAASVLRPGKPLAEQAAAALDAHLEYFETNQNTVVAANRTLAGDPVVAAIISEELTELRRRVVALLHGTELDAEATSAVVMSWLLFVKVLCVEWLTAQILSREVVREICLATLFGALGALGLPNPA